MRKSKILAQIRAGKPARIAMLGHFLPPFIAYAADAGYDGIWLDLEHRAFDHREVQAILAFFHLYDIDCLLRPATRDKASLYRYLEDGAAGLVVPHVSTVEEAADLVRKVKYPPVGDRGVNGIALEAHFGLDIPHSRDALIEHALQETFLIVQIETPEGARKMREIAQIPGVDGFFVGPEDLKARMRHEAPENQQAYELTLEQLAAICANSGKVWGTMAKSADELRALYHQGAQLLVWGIDVSLLREGLAQCGRDLDTIISAKP